VIGAFGFEGWSVKRRAPWELRFSVEALSGNTSCAFRKELDLGMVSTALLFSLVVTLHMAKPSAGSRPLASVKSDGAFLAPRQRRK